MEGEEGRLWTDAESKQRECMLSHTLKAITLTLKNVKCPFLVPLNHITKS